MINKKNSREKLKRIYIREIDHLRIAQQRLTKKFDTLHRTVEYVLDNQRPENHQEEIDELTQSRRDLVKKVEKYSWDIHTIFQYMKDNHIGFEMSESMLQELDPDIRRALETSGLLLESQEPSYDYFTPTVKVGNESNAS